MIRSINLIVKWVGIVIIPIGLILFWQSHFVNGESITKSVTSTVAAIIGMIPEGLYLLTIDFASRLSLEIYDSLPTFSSLA